MLHSATRIQTILKKSATIGGKDWRHMFCLSVRAPVHAEFLCARTLVCWQVLDGAQYDALPVMDLKEYRDQVSACCRV
jgi:hypothetical protein